MSSPTRESLNNIFGPLYDRQELKQAFFNIVAIALAIILAAVGYAVYCILQVFIRPLLWAVLIGVCLHPFKSRLTNALRQWLTSLETSGTPLTLSLAALPFSIISFSAEYVFTAVINHVKILLACLVALPISFYYYHYGAHNQLYLFTCSTFEFISSCLSWFSTFWFLTIILGYVAAVIFVWTPTTAVWLQALSIPMWILSIVHIASIAGPLRVPFFLALIILWFVGRMKFIGNEKIDRKTLPNGFYDLWKLIKPPAKPTQATQSHFFATGSTLNGMKGTVIEEEEGEEAREEGSSSLLEKEEESKKAPSLNVEPCQAGDEILSCRPDSLIHTPSSQGTSGAPGDTGKEPSKGQDSQENPMAEKELEEDEKTKKSSSRPYFVCLFWAHVAVYVWSHSWVVQLLPIPVVIVCVKKLCSKFGGRAALNHYSIVFGLKIESWLGDRKDALAPPPVRGIFKLLVRGDNKIRRMLDSTLDSVVSIVVILLVVFATIALTLFLAFQINRESVQLVTMTSDILNNTMHSELLTWVPQRDNVQKLFESMAGNAYVFGREWISKKIQNFFDTDNYNKAKIEEQALELWDRLYQRIIHKNDSKSGVPPLMRTDSLASFPASVEGLWDTLSTFELFTLSHVVDFVKENLGFFMSVLESVWLLLKGNFSLCLSILSAIFSIILGGGTAVLNFVLSTVIFSTTLFYLLAFSDRNFLVVDFMSQYFYTPNYNQQISQVFHAVESAVSGVFTASLKMALFYGFFTCLTHLIFGVNLVVIPSVLAALFGAVPFLGTYWATVPAIIELSLIWQEPILALVLLACHLLPTYFVDVSIYKEIEGAGHPYLTGLAIAGGIYYFGLEGAITGPILLCCLLVAVNIYKSIFVTQSSPDAESLRVAETNISTAPICEDPQC